MPNNRPFRILSIDGGGMLGLYSAAVLRKLEAHYGLAGPGRGLTSCFDLIVGTSAGAIISCGLVAGRNASEMTDFFLVRGPDIFSNTHAGTLMDFLRQAKQAFFSTKHDNEKLERNLREVLGEATMGDVRERLLVNSFDVKHGRTMVFKSPYKPKFRRKFGSIPLWEIALASSAAPTYLPEYFIQMPGEQDMSGFVDGGTWANNPAMVGLTEAFKLIGSRARKVEILSVASCSEEIKRAKRLSSLITSWGMDIFGAFMTSQSSAVDYMMGRLLVKGGHRYIRIEPEVTEQEAKRFTADNTYRPVLDEMIGKAERDTQAKLENPHTKRELDRIFR